MSTEVTALESQATTLSQTVEALQVVDADTFAEAGELAKTMVVYIRRVGEVMDPIVEAAHRTHKVAVAQRDSLLKPAMTAKRILGDRMATWEQAQARLRKAAELAAQRERERLEREAREQAEAEQRRLQAEAETQRLEEAAALEARGDRDGAERLIAAPVPAVVVVPELVFAPRPPVAAAPKVEGVSFRDEWTYEVVAPFQVPREYLEINHKALGAVVRGLKGATNIPGIRVYARRVSAVRTG